MSLKDNVIIFVADSQYIIRSEEFLPMSNAFQRCRSYGGTLITMEELTLYRDQITQQCNQTSNMYWIGNYSTLTRFLSLEGIVVNFVCLYQLSIYSLYVSSLWTSELFINQISYLFLETHYIINSFLVFFFNHISYLFLCMINSDNSYLSYSIHIHV